MSVDSVDFVNSYPAIFANADKKFGRPTMRLPHGAASVTYKVQQSTGQSLGSGTSYNINLSENNLISNYLLEQMTIQFQVSVTNGITGSNYTPTLETLCAPNFMPLLMNSTMLQVQLNGQAFTINPQNWVDKILTFNKLPDMAEYDLSMCPNALDIFSTYPASATSGNPVYGSQSGTVKNPFGDFSTSTLGNTPRWCQVTDVSVTPALGQIAPQQTQTYTIQFTVTEPILNPTTAMTSESARCWANLNSLSVTRNFLTNADVGSRLVKCIQTPVTGITQAIVPGSIQLVGNNSPVLLYTQYVVDQSFDVPKETTYPLTNYQPLYPSNPITLGTVGTTQIFTSPSIPLSYVPSCIYLFIAKSQNASNIAYASEAPGFRIKSISMDYVTSGNFASCSEVVLYQEFGAKQGIQKSYAEFGNVLIQGVDVGAYGSVYRIDSTNLPIDWSKYSVGSPYNQQLQFTVSGINIRADTFQLYVQVVDQGIYTLSGTDCVSRIGIASVDIVKNARAQDKNYEAHQPSMGGALSHAMRRVHHGFKKMALHKLVPAVVHHAKKAIAGKIHRKKVHHSRRRGRGVADKECGCDYDEHCNDCLADCDECNNNADDFSESEYSEYDDEPVKKVGGRAITKSIIAKRLNY